MSKIGSSESAALPGDSSLTSARCFGGHASRSIMSGVALAALFAMGTLPAKADDTSTAELAAEIHALKAQLKQLENKVNSQSVRIRAVQQQGPIVKGPPVAYEPPHPWDKKFYLNGITITPGGFLAAEGVWRSRDTEGDFSPAFGSLPEYNSPLAHLNELRGTARQSRVSLLVQGNYNPDTLISGYGELDFLGAGVTPNSNESNSYNPRIRVLYGTIDWADEGFHVLAGQNWSLATLQSKGISPRNEVIPTTIDAQYVAGFTWTRQPQIRITKNFGDEFWLAASAEMPQTTSCTGGFSFIGGSATNASTPVSAVNGNGVVCDTVGSTSGSSVLNSTAYYSLNHIPDIIAKAAWEPSIADRKIHIEGFGIYSDEYDYVENGDTTGAVSLNNSRYDTTGWGAGGGFTAQVIPKLIDVQGSGMIGRGIGRYGSSQLADAAFGANGALDPLPEAMFLGGVSVHATPQLDLYAYGGEEKILSTDFISAAVPGYVSPAANNSGCYFVNGACTGKIQDAWEVTAGFWDKVYQGDLGSVRVGLQYAYIQNDLFPGSGFTAVPGATPLAPDSQVHFNEQEVYASFRYYPFDPPPAAPPLVAKY
jgi:hypothetical protein